MAKSLRSKTKRAFRSKKREEGVYAATAAARLNRLNAKLLQTTKRDPQGDEILEDPESQADALGWCWFATFGLLDPNDITLESLEHFSTAPPSTGRTRTLMDSHSDMSDDYDSWCCSRFFIADSQSLTHFSCRHRSWRLRGTSRSVFIHQWNITCIFMYIILVDAMPVDSEQQSGRVSTHGPRGSRREEWRKSKGLPARNAPNGMNRQGGVAARRKAGRSKRRRWPLYTQFVCVIPYLFDHHNLQESIGFFNKVLCIVYYCKFVSYSSFGPCFYTPIADDKIYVSSGKGNEVWIDFSSNASMSWNERWSMDDIVCLLSFL